MKEATRSKRARAEWSRWAAAAVAVAILCAIVAWQEPAQAGGPLLVGGTFGADGVAFTWNTAGAVSYHTDQGALGSLNTAAADGLVRDSFDVWQDVPTANINFTHSGDLGLDVSGSNHVNFFNNFINDCNPPVAPSPTSAVNAIVYDTDGSITSDLLGAGQEEQVIGFAGAVCVGFTAPSTNRITRGRAVLNGKFIDGLSSPTDLSQAKYEEVFTHEFGHLIGLDHSQVNQEVFSQGANDDILFGLPLMFPVIFSNTPARADQTGFPPLAPDDEAWVSFLYPETTNSPPTRNPFSNQFGRIRGDVLFSDGQTPVQGVNLMARLQDNGATPEDETRRFVYSSTSGYLFTGNPGQSVTGTNTGGSSFGSRDPTDIGFFQIPLKAGSYTLEVEAIDPDWVEGSRVGPLGGDAGEQFPLPGPREFWDAGESNADDPSASSLITVAAGASEVRDIILNGTPPRFDSFESARLFWREPAPAWLRERRPPAFEAAG